MSLARLCGLEALDLTNQRRTPLAWDAIKGTRRNTRHEAIHSTVKEMACARKRSLAASLLSPTGSSQ
jgi:hypothetical protein